MTNTNPRFQVVLGSDPGTRRVWDSWLHVTIQAFSSDDGGELAQLLAETRAAELNLPYAEVLSTLSRLALHLQSAREREVNPGDLLEDVDAILEHYIGRLRGVKTENLNPAHLYAPAAWLENL